ncbi:MAG: hypothetical protein WBF49_05335, partial [Methyloceanibacter sp.]
MAEDLRLLLDLEALSRMRPESLLKDCLNILVRHGLCENFWGGQSWQNPVWLSSTEERSARGKRTVETANKGSNCGRNRYVCFGSLAVECEFSGMSASPTFRGCRPHAQGADIRWSAFLDFLAQLNLVWSFKQCTKSSVVH